MLTHIILAFMFLAGAVLAYLGWQVGGNTGYIIVCAGAVVGAGTVHVVALVQVLKRSRKENTAEGARYQKMLLTAVKDVEVRHRKALALANQDIGRLVLEKMEAQRDASALRQKIHAMFDRPRGDDGKFKPQEKEGGHVGSD